MSVVERIEHAADLTLAMRKSGRFGPVDGEDEINFMKPSTTAGVPKLYTVALEGRLLYVGITKQSVSTRLRQGFAADGKTGYHGYKWKDMEGQLALSIWIAPANPDDPDLVEIQTVEAEVAYFCRHLSGQWPQFQHEIHFYPSKDIHREVARRIYEHAVGGSG